MLHVLAWVSLAVAFASAICIISDEMRRPQTMWIMNVVWPVTALYFSVFAVWAYFTKGQAMHRPEASHTPKHHASQPGRQQDEQPARNPTWSQTALAVSHCGAGCVLADIATEFAVHGTRATLLGTELYASFLWDFIAAWLLGILFQYFTIKPMRHLSMGTGIWAAVKADTLSILAFQVGMYGWMTLVFFKLFPQPHLRPYDSRYWLMMQVAMICGYITALPVNWLLVKTGWKEAMG